MLRGQMHHPVYSVIPFIAKKLKMYKIYEALGSLFFNAIFLAEMKTRHQTITFIMEICSKGPPSTYFIDDSLEKSSVTCKH